MKKIELDPRIFDTADDYDKMIAEVQNMAESARHTIERLNDIANSTFETESDVPYFQLMELPQGPSASPSQEDIGIIAIIPDANGTPSSQIFDLSFAIQQTKDGFMFAGAQVRTDSRFIQTEESDVPAFARHPQPDNIIGADHKMGIDTAIFAWIKNQLPLKQKLDFQERVKADDSVMMKRQIGFVIPSEHAKNRDLPSLEEA